MPNNWLTFAPMETDTPGLIPRAELANFATLDSPANRAICGNGLVQLLPELQGRRIDRLWVSVFDRPGRDRWSVRLTHNALRNRYEARLDGRRTFGIFPSLAWAIERKFRIYAGYVHTNGARSRQGDLFYVEFDYSESRRARR